MHPRPSIALLAAMCALSVAGCGAGAESKSTSTSRQQITKSEYMKRANAICKDAAKRSPEFPGQKSGGGLVTTASQVVPYLKATSKISEQTLRRLEKLPTPAGYEARVERLVDAQRERLKDQTLALNAALQANSHDFTAAFQKDQQIDGPAYVRAAAKLGLSACSG